MKKTALPSSYTGSPGDMRDRTYNGLGLCWKIGHPLFFITFTCNPKWPEITSLLLPGQTASDRPDLTGRVFELKLKALLKRLSGGMIFRILVSEEDTFRAHPNDKPTSLTPNIVFRSILERMDGARHQHQSTPVPMTTIPMDV